MNVLTTIKSNDWNAAVKTLNDNQRKSYYNLDAKQTENEAKIQKLEKFIDKLNDNINVLRVYVNMMEDLNSLYNFSLGKQRNVNRFVIPNEWKYLIDEIDPARGCK